MFTRSKMEAERKQPETVFIGLGGNVGNVIASMVSALNALDIHDEISVAARSSLYQTPPWGDVDQDDFVNACARLETTLEPLELLKVMKAQEMRLKRKKTRRWGPRTIDLDILVFSDRSLCAEGLQIPHPRMTDRAFVLLPLLDIAADERVHGRTIGEWMEKLDASDIVRLDDTGGWKSGEVED